MSADNNPQFPPQEAARSKDPIQQAQNNLNRLLAQAVSGEDYYTRSRAVEDFRKVLFGLDEDVETVSFTVHVPGVGKIDDAYSNEERYAQVLREQLRGKPGVQSTGNAIDYQFVVKAPTRMSMAKLQKDIGIQKGITLFPEDASFPCFLVNPDGLPLDDMKDMSVEDVPMYMVPLSFITEGSITLGKDSSVPLTPALQLLLEDN